MALSDVTVHYPGATSPAVDSFSLEIAPGTTTVLLGSSGCGKTTLLRTMNRMVEPTSGTVRVRGEDVRQANAVQLRRSIGYVLQEAGLLPHRTVAQNIATVLRLNGAGKKEAAAAAAEAADMVGLDAELLDRHPAQLSGGQQQRAGVARALAADPDILLMDEPFGAVDPIVRRGLQDLMLDLQQRLRKTVVLVTHDVSEAMTLADHIVLLRQGGKIAQQGTPEQLATHPADEFVRDFLDASARGLRVERRGEKELVVDSRGSIVGVLDQASPTHHASATSQVER
ncbi:MAG TPA: ATP-binding cassette domain-containing protein [Candidatus Corynebacterium gallistercoris]|uniref:ABC-type quaternary amine transporter n=1 Tax=Candidatus Corynebacterium gallistercoris TaxID=2838530 RepID=A0A9D1RWX5_9CORY|nr:ATP-binding cassette domain-containing protein [Candidatus Corynebacterium gallistercoris]